MCKYSSTSIDISNGNSNDILIAIEKKIQIIVKDTKKIIEKLSDNFEKKLNSKINKKI